VVGAGDIIEICSVHSTDKVLITVRSV
jgi:hypothetical protein